jgi:hypothetical protein
MQLKATEDRRSGENQHASSQDRLRLSIRRRMAPRRGSPNITIAFLISDALAVLRLDALVPMLTMQ